MTVLARITREPAALLGLGTAVVGLLVLTGVVTPEVGGGIGILAGALVTCLRYFVTPVGEVVAQQLPGGALVAGRASIAEAGTPLVSVGITPADFEPGRPGEHRADDVDESRDLGASSLELVLIVVGVIALVAVALAAAGAIDLRVT